MAERPSERVSLPSAEEFRMVRAIAFLALSEAARRGEARASFRGFHVHAARAATSSSSASIDVDLRVRFGERLVERSVIAVRNQYSGSIKRHPDAIEGDETEQMMISAVS